MCAKVCIAVVQLDGHFVHVSRIQKFARGSQLTSTPDSQGFSGLAQPASLQQQWDQGNPVVLPAYNFYPVHIPGKVGASDGKASAVEHMYSSAPAGAMQCHIRMVAVAVIHTDEAARYPVVHLVGSN